MSDGRRQSVSDSWPLLEVEAKNSEANNAADARELAEGTSQSARDGKDKRDSGRGPEEDESSDEDDPMLQEMKEEIERTAFWGSDDAEKKTNEDPGHHHPSSAPQTYTSRIATLMDRMDEAQKNRFEAFRRSTLSRSSMKKLVSSLINQTLNDEKVNIVLCSLGKMFVGDLVESARRLANEEKHVGALTRSHIFQAYRTLRRNSKLVKRRTGRFFSNL